MAFLRKQEVLASIKTRRMDYRGNSYTIYEAYFGTDPYTKKPVRRAARSVEKLRREVAAFYQRRAQGGDAAACLSPAQAADARAALDLLSGASSALSLSECVRRVLAGECGGGAARPDVTLAEAFADYSRAQERKSEGHQRAVRFRVGTWVERFGGGRMVGEVTAMEVVDDLERTCLKVGTEEEKTTYNGKLNYIKSFLAWCAAERGYVAANPLAAVKPLAVGYRDPEYMTAADTERLFRVLEGRGGPDLADAVLSFFCGMRQEEIQRVPEGEGAVVIDLEEEYIRVVKCKGNTKGVKPRAFSIPPQALAWMRSMPDFVAAARTPNPYFRPHLVAAGAEAGVRVPENAGRHTFCTMFEAAHHDANALTGIVGNTPDVRDRHYNGVAKPQDGRDYFLVMPSAAVSGSAG